MSTVWAIGYTGVGAVFLSAVAYMVHVSASPSVATQVLTLTFLVLNGLGWGLGYFACSRRPGEPFGRVLLLLGDVIFPLNLYAPFFLYDLSPFKHQVFHSASAVLFIGVIYHLMAYLQLKKSRFPAFFYPYFFAASGGALLYFSHFTLSLSFDKIVWLILGLALVLHALRVYWDLQPRRHFSLAILALLIATPAVVGRSFLEHPTAERLAVFFAVTGVLCSLAWTTRPLGPICRLFGLACYGVFTLAFTASLYSLGAPGYLYLIATAAWVWVLTLLRVVLKSDQVEPFQESAYWLSVLLGLGLVIYLAPVWLVQAGFPLNLNKTPAFSLPSWPEQAVTALVPLLLVALSGAFFVGSFWKWRHPTIAFSPWGFVVNTALLYVTSTLSPVLLVLASSGLWVAFGGQAFGVVFVPLTLGIFYLFIAQPADRLYPMAPLKVAGHITIFASALISLGDSELAIIVFLSGAFVFLWRSVREGAFWPHLYFLGMGTGAALLAATKLRGSVEMLPLAIFAAALVGVSRWLLTREGRDAEGQLTLVLAIVVGAGAAIGEGVLGHFSPWVFLPIWLGFLAGLAGWRGRSGQEAQALGTEEGEWVRTAGHWVAHGAGGAWVVSGLAGGGLPAGYMGPALAGWAWLHFGASQLLAAGAPGGVTTRATRHAVHGFALLSLLLAAVYSSSAATVVVSLLGNAILYFHMPSGFVEGSKGLRMVGYALTFAAIGLAAVKSVEMTIVTLFSGALVFLWRSVRERSFWPHLYFLVMVTGAAILAAVWLLGRVEVLVLGLLSVGLLGVYRWLLTLEGRNAKIRLTLAWALVVGGGAATFEVARGHLSPLVFLPIWLGFLVGVGGWKGGPGREPDGPSEKVDKWLRVVGYWVAHGAGGAWLVSMLTGWGFPAGYAGPALAAWAWGHFGASQLLGARAPGREATTATRHAVHGFALLSLLLAAVYWEEGALSIFASFLTGSLYVVLRLIWMQEFLEHAAALAFIEALSLLGMRWQIVLPEFYLTPLGFYLCLTLYLKLQRKPVDQRTMRPYSSSVAGFNAGLRFVRENLLPLAILLITVVYPFWALVQSLHEVHIFFLGGATVILLYVFLTTRQHPIFVYLVCLLFVLGAAYLLALGNPDQRVNLFLVLVGSLVIADLVFLGRRADGPLPSWGGNR